MHRESGNIVPRKLSTTGIRRDLTRHGPDQSGLASPIWPNESVHFPRHKRQIKPLRRQHRTILFHQLLHDQERLRHNPVSGGLNTPYRPRFVLRTISSSNGLRMSLQCSV